LAQVSFARLFRSRISDGKGKKATGSAFGAKSGARQETGAAQRKPGGGLEFVGRGSQDWRQAEGDA
jgi:hypothetical protein